MHNSLCCKVSHIINNIRGFIKTVKSFIKSLLFGAVFSISWTPCIGTFLSSALLLIAKEQDIIKGIIFFRAQCRRITLKHYIFPLQIIH